MGRGGHGHSLTHLILIYQIDLCIADAMSDADELSERDDCKGNLRTRKKAITLLKGNFQIRPCKKRSRNRQLEGKT